RPNARAATQAGPMAAASAVRRGAAAAIGVNPAAHGGLGLERSVEERAPVGRTVAGVRLHGIAGSFSMPRVSCRFSWYSERESETLNAAAKKGNSTISGESHADLEKEAVVIAEAAVGIGRPLPARTGHPGLR
ncbi:hypothetical protein P3W85_14025, partial [Cupriavidus basilensis]|nr:hypothetical protein [Cupriavidus basilensis]